jgi:hypothetical protein
MSLLGPPRLRSVALILAAGFILAAGLRTAVAETRPGPCSAHEVAAAEPAFPDLAGHWAREEAELLSEAGLFAGYGGRFHPDEALTRAQVAAVLARLSLLLEPGRLQHRQGTATEFADVPPGHWAREFVSRVSELGIMKGEGHLFHPDRPLSRQELALLVVRVLGLERDASARSEAPVPFSDGEEVAPWARGAVVLMAERGIMQGLPGGRFAPRDSVTRGQAARLLVRLGRSLGVPGFEEVEAKGRVELSALEGCHFELLTASERYVLIPAHPRIKEELERLLGQTVTVRGRLYRGPDIYMRGPLLRVRAVNP